MVHSTGSNNPNLRRYVGPDDGTLGNNTNNNHWNMSGTGACVHAFIGKLSDGTIATYQTLPWNMRGWHAGRGTKGSANNTHISFEICEDNLGSKDYFDKVYKEAVELTAHLCILYNLDPMKDGVVICHSEGYSRGIASNHGDVMHWFPKYGKSMDTFRRDVNSQMAGNQVITDSYLVKVTATKLNIRSGPSTSYKIVGTIEDQGVYTIVETKGNWGKLKSKIGWISLSYTRRV